MSNKSNNTQRRDDTIEYSFRNATKIELGCPFRVKNLVTNALLNKAITVIVGEKQTRISLLELTSSKKFNEIDYIVNNSLLKSLGLYADITNQRL